jgi:fatty-acyl-CoA synthase
MSSSMEPNLNWYAVLAHHAVRSPDQVMTVFDGAPLTYAETDERVQALAAGFAANGIGRGDVVGLLSYNCPEFLEALFAINYLGAIAMPINWRLAAPEVRYILEHSQARGLVCDESLVELADAATTGLEDSLLRACIADPAPSGWTALASLRTGSPPVAPAEVAPNDVHRLMYTSGTTGRPKGVVLSHRAIREVGFNLALELDVFRRGEQVVLPQPVSHGAGYFILPALMGGGGVRLIDRFDPEEALALSGSGRVRTLKIVPAMMDGLLAASEKQPFGYDSLLYGAAPIAAPVLERALDRFGPVLTQIYGQSEAPATLTCLPAWAHEGDGEQRFSAGLPWRTVALEVCDPDGDPVPAGELGEVLIRGPHMMNGYHGLPEATAEVIDHGWLRTKDMARRDERGFVYLQGRRDEMINSGGFNISPGEVERVLVDHPDVEEAVVVGLPDERWGHAVNAAVRLRSGAAASADEVIGFARPRLGFRTPKAVLIFDDIPRNSYGKVDRPSVVARLEEGVR